MTTSLDLRILGPIEAYCDGIPVSLGGPRQRTVLAALLLNADRVVSIERITEALWEGSPPATSKTQIAICIAALRKTFKAAGCTKEVIATSAPGYLIRTRGQRLDLREFAERLAAAREATRKQGAARGAEEFEAALELWRGPALAGITSQVIQSQVTQLDEQRLVALEERARLRLELGEHGSLITELQNLVEENPLREQARGYLMLATYRCGRRAQACELYRETRRLFVEELGIEPGPHLQALHESILNDDPALSVRNRSAVPEPHGSVPAQLPANTAAFTGREPEIAVLDQLVSGAEADGGSAIGYLIGEAGIGKTSLATWWAHRVGHHFPDGQLFADLRGRDTEHKGDPYRILDGFLRALGVADERIPAEPGERGNLYRSILAERRLLLVLDDVGQHSKIRPLLPGSGRCAVLITGTNPIGEVLGSHAPERIELARLDEQQSLALITKIVGRERIGAQPEAAARLTKLCGGLPLALRIAAAKLTSKPHWTVQRLVDRLADPGQRLNMLSHGGLDLRSRLRDSYRQLDDIAARLYRRLGMLELSEFTVAMAASILELGAEEAENAAERLIDAQLLRIKNAGTPGNLVYEFPEFHRLYARERCRIEEPPEQDAELTERIVSAIG